jgi:hypothetical protein
MAVKWIPSIGGLIKKGQTWRQYLRDRVEVPSVAAATRSKPRR